MVGKTPEPKWDRIRRVSAGDEVRDCLVPEEIHELEGVVAGSTDERVVTAIEISQEVIPSTPKQRVVTGATIHDVPGATANERIVAVLAAQGILPRTAQECVVAVAAEWRIPGHSCR